MKRPEVEAARWIAQARDDLEFARWLLVEDRGFDKGCFITQQAAEKALEAILYLDGARTVLGHLVHEPLERLVTGRPAMAVLRDDARRIDRFYIPTRCPNGLPGGTPFETFTREDLRQAVALAERIVASANAIIPNGG